MDKYICHIVMQLFSLYNIHPYDKFLDALHLYHNIIKIFHYSQYVTKEVSF